MQTIESTVQVQAHVSKPLAYIRTAKRSEPDMSNHYFYDGKTLEGGFVVPIGLYNTVKFEAIAILNYLAEGNEYDAEDLFGPGYWDQLQPYEQRLIDPCLLTLVAAGELPLEVANPGFAYPVLYRLDLRHETLVKAGVFATDAYAFTD
jgi:hypothetical protein